MEGLVKEGAETMREEYEDAVMDSPIGAAQRVEHYEIAGYGTAKESPSCSRTNTSPCLSKRWTKKSRRMRS
jgi:ferritin-like metal-binding protein YciE